jgi:hypothetical protein
MTLRELKYLDHFSFDDLKNVTNSISFLCVHPPAHRKSHCTFFTIDSKNQWLKKVQWDFSLITLSHFQLSGVIKVSVRC